MAAIDISIIIPTRNREAVLWVTLAKAIAAIEVITNAEVLVINDGDEDLDIPARYNSVIKFYRNPKKGVSTARNFGADNAKGSILFFIDDDMWINKEALGWINNYFSIAENAEAVYNINWHYPQELTQKLIQTKIGQYQLAAAYNTMWGRMVTGQKLEPAQGLYAFNCIMSGSLVMSKTTFEKTGRYNEKMIFQGEDADLTEKINAAGIKIFCVFDVMLFHNQQDRFEIDNFLVRASDGFASEFKAAKEGFITNRAKKIYKMPGSIIFLFFFTTEFFWIWLLKILPNNTFWRLLNNRLIGMLNGLQHYKQWRLYKTV